MRRTDNRIEMPIAERSSEPAPFWQPPGEARVRSPQVVKPARCERCETEFLAGSRYCHVCGSGRYEEPWHLPQWMDWRQAASLLGIPSATLAALLAGMTFLLIAVLLGAVYETTTVLEWQAVQSWRIQWLLAAVAAFTAGILLKR